MKKNKLIIGGIALGIVSAGSFAVSHFSTKKSAYAHQKLSVADSYQKPEGMKIWWDAHHIDEETGLVATREKIQQGYEDARIVRASQPRVSSFAWQEQGPENYGGRTRALCVDRTNENHVYAGSVSGGLFESFNKGNNWSKVPDWDAFMYISAIVQTQDGTIFVGTGEGAPFQEPFSVGGRGVYYKNPNDPDAVWTLVPGSANLDVNELAAAPVNNKVFIGTTSGLRMWDKSAGGNISAVSVGSGSCNEVEISGDGQVILTRFGTSQTSGCFGSVDGGATWNSLHGAGKLPAAAPGVGGRVEFAISKNRVNGEYICYANGTNGTTAGVFRSSTSGATWDQIAPGSNGTDSPVNFYGLGQGIYNSTNAVDPTNPNRLLVGGLDIHEWTIATTEPVTGGWAQLSLWFTPNFSPLHVHADNHRIVFDSQNRMYIGNDGGIGISENIGQTYIAANRGYATIQFYSIAVDGKGRLIGGAQDNGTLYNSLQNATPMEFRQMIGGDGFDAAISFYNPNIMFGTLYYGAIQRTGNQGAGWGGFIPNYVGYAPVGDVQNPSTSSDFHFHNRIGLGEFYDLNSKDSVQFSPTFSATAGTLIQIPSFATGNLIPHTLANNVYFDDTVEFNPALTITDFQVKDLTTGTTFQLYPLTWTNETAPGQDPQVGHVLQVTAPTVFTITVQTVSTYNRYFAQHPITGKLLDLVTNEFLTNVSWDTIKVADPYQSIFLTHARKNGGELYMTRDALRLSSSNVKWSQVVTGIGAMFTGEIAFSADLEHVYVGTSTGLWRIDGIRDVYSTEANFTAQTDLRAGSAPAITKTLIYSGAVSGVSVNPADPGDVLITRAGVGGSGRIFRSTTADVATGSGTFQDITGNLTTNMVCYDVLVDRTNSNLLLVGTDYGVYFTTNGGTTWTYSSEGFGEVPVYRIVQNWREGHPNTTRPGEIYIATFGRGMFASDSVLDIDNIVQNNAPTNKFEIMVYPNPLQNDGTIRFELKDNANVQTEIYTISGRLVYSNKSYLTGGVHNLAFDASKFDNGAYIVKVTAGDEVSSAKFIKH
jgi:hypothetical protein